MHLNADISSALALLEEIKQSLDGLGDQKLRMNTYQDVVQLITALENPVFRSIVTIQDSLNELNQQLGQHPSILPVDFDITPAGKLVLSVPPVSNELYGDSYTNNFQLKCDYDEQRVPSAQISPTSPLVHSFQIPDKASLSLTRNTSSLVDNLEKSRLLHRHQSFNTVPPDDEDVIIFRPPSSGSDISKTGSDLMNSEWSQVESIDLVNDGTGLGFGIVGMKTMGVVVKTILPGGVADRDGKLQSGDHILQIGEVNLYEMGSEQVASVLRQSGTHVRLVVARPVHTSDYRYLGSAAPLVPTRLLHDPIGLDRYLIQRNYPPVFRKKYECFPDLIHFESSQQQSLAKNTILPRIPASPSLPLLDLDMAVKVPETEKFIVELKKDANGLGITIAGYVCEKEELSGIFVKSVNKGSAADLNGNIKVNDRIVEVDGQSLQGYTNLQAVEVLRNCGNIVQLCVERYLHGPKFEQLQQAIAANEGRPTPPSPPPPPPPLPPSSTTTDLPPLRCSTNNNDDDEDDDVDENFIKRTEMYTTTYLSGNNTYDSQPSMEELRRKWEITMGSDAEIVIAELMKFSERGGLGISLEGTVDVEDGQEVRPHHYIRSILPEGPVGTNAVLKSGDELLEVNGHKLLGINHHEVVSILKELPINVCIVCARNTFGLDDNTKSYTLEESTIEQQRPQTLNTRSSVTNLLPSTDRLVKAKSDGSLASSTAAASIDISCFNKMKSRSLEPLTGLAMWGCEPQIIELTKGERGLGFSILDYQDPIDPNDTVIVIRSLVPGGVAQIDGRLIPGDRLLFVNDTILENASLDQAVQALKGAPKGVVRIGVAKPLPLPDSVHNTSTSMSDNNLDYRK